MATKTPASATSNSATALTDIPEASGYGTDISYYATRYKQGGRTVYALDLSLEQIRSLIPRPNPDAPAYGNRPIRLKHADDFAKYIRQQPEWVIPALLLRAPSIFKFESATQVHGTEFGVLSFPRLAVNDVKILDGQHRTLGFYLANESIERDLDKARSTLAAARRQDPEGSTTGYAQQAVNDLLGQRERLSGERVSLQIFIEDDPKAFKQMFFDIADNAEGISASIKAQFDTRKVVNRALELVLEHPMLKDRVDMNKDRLGKGSQWLMTAKHVREIVQASVVGLEGRVGKRVEAELDETKVSRTTRDFLDMATASFPALQALTLGQITTEGLRRTSLTDSVLMLRVLASLYHELRSSDHSWSDAQVQEFFTALAPHMDAPVHENTIWILDTPPGSFTVGQTSPSGRRQELKALHQTMLGWALDHKKFGKPKAAPAPEPEDVE